MSGSVPLAYPAAGTLSAWWRQLTPLEPKAGWVGHLFCHRVEAVVQVALPLRLERLDELLLKSLSVGAVPPLPAPLMQRLYHQLSIAGLVAASPNGNWRLTPAGTAAVETGVFHERQAERRFFTFVERLGANQRRIALPHFLPLAAAQPRSWRPSDDSTFAIDRLDDAIRQSDEWKETMQFPLDVVERPRGSSDWRSVPLVRPEHHLVVMVETADPSRALQAFAVRPETMMPHTSPLFALPAGIRNLIPEMFPDVPRQPITMAGEIDLVGDGLVRCVRTSRGS
jgi:hypothetical protein